MFLSQLHARTEHSMLMLSRVSASISAVFWAGTAGMCSRLPWHWPAWPGTGRTSPTPTSAGSASWWCSPSCPCSSMWRCTSSVRQEATGHGDTDGGLRGTNPGVTGQRRARGAKRGLESGGGTLGSATAGARRLRTRQTAQDSRRRSGPIQRAGHGASSSDRDIPARACADVCSAAGRPRRSARHTTM